MCFAEVRREYILVGSGDDVHERTSVAEARDGASDRVNGEPLWENESSRKVVDIVETLICSALVGRFRRYFRFQAER